MILQREKKTKLSHIQGFDDGKVVGASSAHRCEIEHAT